MALLKGTLLRGSVSPRVPLILTPIGLVGFKLESLSLQLECVDWNKGPNSKAIPSQDLARHSSHI